MEIPQLTTILGPTASGKTALATELALKIDAEIISADSRQVYRRMNIGTGKDLSEYHKNDKIIPYHLIDILDPKTDVYSVFQFKKDFINISKLILSRNKKILLCGGTGLYIDAVLRDYYFDEVPINKELRKELQNWSTDILANYLLSVRHVQNKSDFNNRNRLIRLIEIYEFQKKHTSNTYSISINRSDTFGIQISRHELRKRIRIRLEERLKAGMIEEVRSLIDEGVTKEKLISFGLEYKYITLYLLNKLDYNEMVEKLYIAICQFSKRQMTWFRRMEANGVKIIWLDGKDKLDRNINKIIRVLNTNH